MPAPSVTHHERGPYNANSRFESSCFQGVRYCLPYPERFIRTTTRERSRHYYFTGQPDLELQGGGGPVAGFGGLCGRNCRERYPADIRLEWHSPRRCRQRSPAAPAPQAPARPPAVRRAAMPVSAFPTGIPRRYTWRAIKCATTIIATKPNGGLRVRTPSSTALSGLYGSIRAVAPSKRSIQPSC